MQKHITFRPFLRDTHAMAMVEFALVLPMLLSLFAVGFETSRYLLLHQKVDRVAYTVSDVVAQSSVVTRNHLTQIMDAASQIMQPYAFDGDGVVIVSSVYQSGSNPPVVRWQSSGGGSLSRASQIGTVNGNATLPNNMSLNNRDNIIIAEVYYQYHPVLNLSALDGHDIYKTVMFKPRLGALTTPPS